MDISTPKKNGSLEYFQTPEVTKKFKSIRQWLRENCKHVSIQSDSQRRTNNE